jgi:hypothetical protein
MISSGYAQRMILRCNHHKCIGQRCFGFIRFLVALRSSIYNITVLLKDSITNKLVESYTLAIAHGLHQFGTQPPFKTSDLLNLRINKFRSISWQVDESMQILCYAFVSLGELHKLGVLDCHETRRNVMSPKCFLELIPNYFHILKQRIPMMTPPNACRPL